ncbi:hypothetical protein [Actibacterium sp. MT2.3-13A]|uniref:hypothetical protein n=1 Tax=Actibacterium sp. MT2.3-13A TaxID=2828332 RepID=UPI001BAB597B|nr:hypothetical protein [Actibacterium sp. MT2.3-13A]
MQVGTVGGAVWPFPGDDRAAVAEFGVIDVVEGGEGMVDLAFGGGHLIRRHVHDPVRGVGLQLAISAYLV